MTVSGASGPTGDLTVGDLLVTRAATMGERVALQLHLDGEVSEHTYTDLLDRAVRAAGALGGRGVGPGDRVVLVADTGIDLVAALYGIALLGAVAVPVNTGWLPHEVAAAVERVRPAAVLAGGDERVAGLGGAGLAVLPIVELAEPGGVGASTVPPAGSLDAGAAFEVIFTSGTTAQPKGVVLSHRNCLGGAMQAGAAVGWSAGERFCSALPLFHVNAQTFCLWSALVWGGTAILVDRFSASQFPAQLDASGATVTSIVSTQLRTMVRQGSHRATRPRSLRHVVFAINVSDDERAELEEAWDVRLRNGYGLSEAMTLVSIEPAWPVPRQWPSIGFPAVGRSVRIVDGDGQPVGPDQVGELLVGGTPGVDLMLGYWDDPEQTAAAFDGGWLHTGDLVRRGRAGELHYVGRAKDVIKVAGENVSAAEVEEVLASLDGVLECAVVSVPDAVRDERVAAMVAADGAVTVAALRAHADARLARYKRPAAYAIVDVLPRTEIGKVDKAAIRSVLAEAGPA